VAKTHIENALNVVAGPTTGGIDGVLAGEYHKGLREGVKMFCELPEAVVTTLTDLMEVVDKQQAERENDGN